MLRIVVYDDFELAAAKDQQPLRPKPQRDQLEQPPQRPIEKRESDPLRTVCHDRSTLPATQSPSSPTRPDRAPASGQASTGPRRAGRYDSLVARTVKHTDTELDRRRAAAERLRGLLGRDPSRSFTDELIAERRAAAKAETEAEANADSARR
jgi:hypothetical protein